MCGIVGALLAQGSVTEPLLNGLAKLEYRGYDSAGLGLWDGSALEIRKRQGRLEALRSSIEAEPLPAARAGIGHTRWATHGVPSDSNAHPHQDPAGRLALVHNGIIENYAALRTELLSEGAEFTSETDTEVLAHLIGAELGRGLEPLPALQAALERVQGYYAIALLVGGERPQLLCSRAGPPLCIGRSKAGVFLGSDAIALAEQTDRIQYLEDGDVALLNLEGVTIVDAAGQAVEREIVHVEVSDQAVSKGGFEHFMLKEIHEQPDVLARTLAGRATVGDSDVDLGPEWSDEMLAGIERVQVVGCGTALHAGYITRYLFEGLAGVPTDHDFASEFRYRNPQLVPGTLALAISQSGETADTLAALRLAKELGAIPTSICNVRGSTMVRECTATLLTEAGPEIGVASTKAFVSQLVAAVLLAVRLGRARGTLAEQPAADLLAELLGLRGTLEQILAPKRVAHIAELADRHRNVKGFLFLGRGINFPIALEGALKLKEISYMHAEGYPAGEMKHGPIALVEPDMSTVVVNSIGGVAEKSRSNIEQIKARGGRVIAVGSDTLSFDIAEEHIAVPASSEWLSPILNVIPLQLLSYHIARLRGCDIDKPRNLAKSVTVE